MRSENLKSSPLDCAPAWSRLGIQVADLEQCFVAAVHEDCERLAMQGFERQGFRSWAPTLKILKAGPRGRGVAEACEFLFPGYVLVWANLARDRWRSINGTRGVVKLLPVYAEMPRALPAAFVDELQRRDGAGELTVDQRPRPYAPGEQVHVDNGHMSFVGVCVESSAHRVKLLMALLRGTLVVDVPLTHTRPAV